MKKKITTFFAALLIVLLSAFTAFATNRVPEMEIEVVLQPDGSAHITQIWTTDTDEGTEFYLGCNDNGYLSISDFSVTDKNGAYTFVENWDTDLSFEEKANTSGILETNNGVELCWGISQYGENQYTFEYVLHDLVGSYSDADGFNHRFVDEMSFFPSDVVLTIRNQDGTPLTDEACDIWGFGYDGQVIFEDGTIRAWSENPLESGHHITIMVSLEKGILSPQRTVDKSFEEVKELAFVGSDYEKETLSEEELAAAEEPLTFGDILLLLAALLVCLSPLGLIILIVRKVQKNRQKKQLQEIGYFRDAPNGGNLNVTYQLALCDNLCKDESLLGAYLLRLVSQGCLECIDDTEDEKSARLRLCHAPHSGEAYDDVLYTIMEAAAGEDGILQPMEFEQYCNRNRTPIFKFMDSVERNGLQTLISNNCLKGDNLYSKLDLNENGKKELNEILGLKNYLLDFSLIQEREVTETIIWQDYMVYALMLGIADKLEKQIQDLYPDQIPYVNQYHRYIRHTHYYRNTMYDAYYVERARRKQTRRSSGSGGSASFGGGGYSGGGGGGTR